ncbi:helix-turn-helix domain-containing protein [Desulfobacter latus]|uniref:Helix-turn-helix transcriptional regulator n=1 Tax=Desulfobacter latus TaxID=2292 RepID=A0A850SXV4_9BACT|nr:helix-turn-helix transcriptional regulator [Desulfobacter latus]
MFGPLTFGKALKAHREGEALSQSAFAKALGISPQSLCDLEKGRRTPSVKRAAKIGLSKNPLFG